ncbi:NADH-quinone oxidoreductase subunit L [Pseudohalioglobus sediminis]|uniref:Probable inorganic carbon transporter subunit DabB n=1 Tax=Pseudohalioglobus sediminis TaxID=2606449 RepID=A0A5B0X173_9GAMM|nr:NADH-quinone oxidoreductase subunit L [Pseudohalioglobus sediminis]KAA1191859.1 NADH-quinone oxidoreductase subunit L [Pseudohalioglobus sediminis]
MSQFLGIWLLPLIYAVGCAAVFITTRQHWHIARLTASAALVATAGAALLALVWAQLAPLAVDVLGLTVALLIAVLGWVIVNYSSRYLNGEPEQPRFVRAMLFTLAAVALLVVSKNLLVIVLAWAATSIGLHHLLTFYRERKAAQVVAHKKFLVSRLAEVCLAVALVLIFTATGTLSLSGIETHLASLDVLPVSLHVAALLFALAAILKAAQLPLHGWLIQVMEAPTPVSALLHAGIVNMGGFVLIRLADLVTMAPAAQAALVIVGSLTAVLAALVMLTRISIKVRLAWSTCAQMGFMLMEIGLGLYELALLHLVAHSLYKAFAFLSAGETVRQARSVDFLEPGTARTPLWYLGALLVSAALVVASAAVWQWLLPAMAVPPVALLIVALGLASLLWLEQGLTGGQFVRGVLRVLALTQLYLLWHLMFAGLAPAPASVASPLVAWVVACFAVLYCTQIWLRCYPQGRFARAFFPWAYCGFYLDETFTRLTFKIWPVTFTPLQAQTLANRYHHAQSGESL